MVYCVVAFLLVACFTTCTYCLLDRYCPVPPSTHTHTGTEHLAMMDELCSLAQQGKLRPPLCSEHALRDYKTALVRAMEPFVGSKQLLVMKN